MDAEGCFFVLPGDVTDGVLVVDHQVELLDYEGNQARGQIARLTDRGALVSMIAGSWQGSQMASIPQTTGSLQQQVAGLLESSLDRARALGGWYRLSRVSSSSIAEAVGLPSGLPEPQGAVPSTV
jgi:hypothetical protein